MGLVTGVQHQKAIAVHAGDAPAGQDRTIEFIGKAVSATAPFKTRDKTRLEEKIDFFALENI